MPVPSSGAISLNQFHVEAGGSSGTQCSINDSDIRALIGKGSGVTMSFNEWYGASSSVANQIVGNLVYYVTPNSKYNEKSWTMSSFTDNTLGSHTINLITINTSSILNFGSISATGNHTSYTTFQGFSGYRYMKIGSTNILDLSNNQGTTPTYNAGTNITKWNNIGWVSSPAASTQNTTFTFGN